MPALVAGIHVLGACATDEDVDGRDEPGHDGRNAAWPPEDGLPVAFGAVNGLRALGSSGDPAHRRHARACRGIHVLRASATCKDLDGRDEPRHAASHAARGIKRPAA
jgi:hypothetical protein